MPKKSKNQPKVAIITSTFNQLETLKECLSSIKKNVNYKNYKIYFVDDSGTGKIAKEIRKNFSLVNVSENKKNEGYSSSNNRLIKKAIEEYNPDYIFHIDDDAKIIDKNLMSEMINFSEKNLKAGIVGSKVIFPDGSLQWFFRNKKLNFLKSEGDKNETSETFGTYEVSNVIGACFLIKRKVIDEIGLLDEKFNPAYGEETDFCFRASKKGFKLFYLGDTKIVHRGGSSTGHVKDWIWYIKKRNSIRLEWLNHSWRDIIKYTVIHFGSALISKYPFKKTGSLLKAYAENIKNLKEIKQKRRERNNWRKNPILP